MAEQPQQWLTPEELAEELNVPMKTLYVWNHKRKGPAFTRVGKHVRYSRTAVDEWLASHTKQPIAS
ncbi:MAG TPA: helix-turn-helix domain-containing protein [Propionibacteriaceae bacterium]|jgi:excisionase family DNA binding protein|nr:helix-turn-helix domain-containing protein [Propionibacteriaceae bacterium]